MALNSSKILTGLLDYRINAMTMAFPIIALIVGCNSKIFAKDVECYAVAKTNAVGLNEYPLKKGRNYKINSYSKSSNMLELYRLGDYRLKDFQSFSFGCAGLGIPRNIIDYYYTN